MFKINFKCGCGSDNYNMEDWLSHWKYGTKRGEKFFDRHPKLRAIKHFLNTRIYFG